MLALLVFAPNTDSALIVAPLPLTLCISCRYLNACKYRITANVARVLTVLLAIVLVHRVIYVWVSHFPNMKLAAFLWALTPVSFIICCTVDSKLSWSAFHPLPGSAADTRLAPYSSSCFPLEPKYTLQQVVPQENKAVQGTLQIHIEIWDPQSIRTDPEVSAENSTGFVPCFPGPSLKVFSLHRVSQSDSKVDSSGSLQFFGECFYHRLVQLTILWESCIFKLLVQQQGVISLLLIAWNFLEWVL